MTNNIQKRYTRYKEYKKEKSQEKYINYFIYALMGCIALCSALIFLSYLCAKLFDLGANDLGDSFGSVNAVISALAFLGVFIALIMQQKQIDLQRKDLALQRRELKNNTKELSLQRKEFEEQNRNIRLQRFENTFFQMLSLHHEIVAGLRLVTFDAKYIPTENIGNYREDIKYEIIGRKTFFEIYNTNLAFDTSGERYRSIKQLITLQDIEGYGKYLEISIFDHYFRNLYRIIKLVDSTPERKNEDDNKGVLTINEKKEYIAILRASLSEYELVMLFFNCLYMRDIRDEPQFKKYAEKYHLFNNIRPEKVGKDLFEKFEGEYEASAFNW